MVAQPIGTAASVALAAVVVVLGLAGCSLLPQSQSQSQTASASPVPSVTAPVASDGPEAPVAPGVRLDLPAADNLAFFDSVNLAVVAADDSAGGRDFIDALTAAGFDRAAMQVTADRTTVDLQAGSVQFSVRLGDECLVGQYGPESGGYHGAVRPALGHGGCLVGQTRPIDW